MTDAASSGATFGVETIELDLPPLAGALSRRLLDAGVPVTPARSADFARALALVRPVSRRRLYWTARAVLVSDPAHVKPFDAVFFSVFGDRDDGEAFVPDELQSVASSAEERPNVDHKISRGESATRDGRVGASASPPAERRRAGRRGRGAARRGE